MSDLTKNALADSLARILETKSLEDIKINDITSDCGISRMTFYYHFKNIYDLIGWIIKREVIAAIKESSNSSNPEVTLYNILLSIRKKRNFILRVERSITGEQVNGMLTPMINDLMINFFDHLLSDIKIDENDKIFLITCYEYALMGAVMQWVHGEMSDDPKALAHRLWTLAISSFSAHVEAFTEKNYNDSNHNEEELDKSQSNL